jgi:5-methylcytosine-specific restriction endonuclease McrA
LSDFYRESLPKDGVARHCKECKRAEARDRYKKSPLKPTAINGGKICSICKIEKPLEAFHVDKSMSCGRKANCKECEFKRSHTPESTKRKQAYQKKYEKSEHRLEYTEKNREHRNARQRAYMRNNKLVIAEVARKRRARLKSAVVEEVSYERILARDGYVCHICGGAVAPDDVAFDHVVPIARHGAHAEFNIKVSHAVCNKRKHSKLMSELTDYDRRGP